MALEQNEREELTACQTAISVASQALGEMRVQLQDLLGRPQPDPALAEDLRSKIEELRTDLSAAREQLKALQSNPPPNPEPPAPRPEPPAPPGGRTWI